MKIQLFIATCLALAWTVHSKKAATSGYFDIQLSPNTVASVPFGPGHVAVWQHILDKQRYYAMPLVYLQHKTALSTFNPITKQNVMTFDVLMWSLEAKEAVYRYLKKHVNPTVEEEDVEILPMERIRLVWKGTPPSSAINLDDSWKTNTHLPSVVAFKFTCDKAEVCTNLMSSMKTTPRFFNSLEMEYVIHASSAARRDLTVTGSQLMNGELGSKLKNMQGAEGNIRYLTSDDVKNLASESVNSVVGTVVTDVNYVNKGDEVKLEDMIENVLKQQEVSSTEFNPKMWDSVFWDKSMGRPDKVTKYLNKVLQKDESDSKKLRVDENAQSQSTEVSLGVTTPKVGVETSVGHSTSSSNKVSKEDFLKQLKERNSDVQWDGEKFTVKPMKLYRMNLSKLSAKRTIATANIQVRKYESVRDIRVRVSDLTNQSPSLTPELVQERLIEKLNEAKQQTNTKLREATQETNTKLEQSENRMKTQLTDKLSPLTSKLNTLPDGQYCILKNGPSCPAGWRYYHAQTPWLDRSHTGGGVHNYYFGWSKLKCSCCACYIEIHACCRG